MKAYKVWPRVSFPQAPMCNKLTFCHQGKVVNQVTGSYSHWASVQAQHPTGTGAHKDRVRANEFEKLLTRLHLSGLLQELVQLSGGDFFPNKNPTCFWLEDSVDIWPHDVVGYLKKKRWVAARMVLRVFRIFVGGSARCIFLDPQKIRQVIVQKIILQRLLFLNLLDVKVTPQWEIL